CARAPGAGPPRSRMPAGPPAPPAAAPPASVRAPASAPPRAPARPSRSPPAAAHRDDPSPSPPLEGRGRDARDLGGLAQGDLVLGHCGSILVALPGRLTGAPT